MLRTAQGGFALVLPDARRVALSGCVTVGRAAECTVQIDEPSVSRRHARILAAIDPPVLEDLGSSNGTFVNGLAVRAGGARLTDGAVVHLGDAELFVERTREPDEPESIRIVGDRTGEHSTRGIRLRPGLSLRRTERGGTTCTLYAPGGGELVRVDGVDAEILERLDGTSTTEELVRELRRTRGAWGVGRFVRLVALLADRGMLDGAAHTPALRGGVVRRLLTPKELTIPGAGRAIAAAYRRGGFLLLTRSGLVALTTISVAGLAALAWLLASHGSTPFVVQSELAYGTAAFVLGRLIGIALHETAHGFVLTSFGHVVPRAGIKLAFGIPFGFVDASQAWLEPRRRRIAVSAAGPACDLVVGGGAAIAGVAIGPGVGADLALQLALAAYVGALINLNPMLERDGHHMLEDLVRVPGLRRRAYEELARRITGGPRAGDESRAVAVYGIAAILWTLATVAIVGLMALAAAPYLTSRIPPTVVWIATGFLAAALLAPITHRLLGALSARRSGKVAHGL